MVLSHYSQQQSVQQLVVRKKLVMWGTFVKDISKASVAIEHSSEVEG